ncbi:MAG TPA: tetratricopeptide repeat protein [Armatimonadota bacterium]
MSASSMNLADFSYAAPEDAPAPGELPVWRGGRWVCPEEAAETFARLARGAPTNPMLRYNLGTAYRQQGRLQEAIAAFREALILKPDLADACSDLGATYGQMALWTEALQVLQEAVRLDPESVEPRIHLAMVHLERGDWSQAVEALEVVTRLRPTEADAHYILGTCYQMLGHRDKALARQHLLEDLSPRLAKKLADGDRWALPGVRIPPGADPTL